MVLALGRMNETTQGINSSNSPRGHDLGPLRTGVSKLPVMPLLKNTWLPRVTLTS